MTSSPADGRATVSLLTRFGEELFPVYSRGERLADATVHVIGVVLSLIAFGALLAVAALKGDPWVIGSVAVYGTGLLLVFSVSAAYHMSPPSPTKAVLRRLDKAAIFLKIAGTYTPFAVVSIGGAWGAGLMAAVWTVAAIGAPLKLLDPNRFGRHAVWLYLAQGWMVVVAAEPALAAIPGAVIALIAIGGILYTIGVVFYVSENMPYQNAIWHVFVLIASGFMYAAVFSGVALA